MTYLTLFILVPLGRGFALSFTNTRLVNPSGGKFVGLANYQEIVSGETFRNSLISTVAYTAGTVTCTLLLGTLAAILVNRSFAGRTVVRAVLAFPYAMPTVAVALIFAWMYNPSKGAFNSGLSALGIGQAGWLTDPSLGMPSVIVTTVWKVFPFVMLVVLAALQSVPEELFEAARVDGADVVSVFSSIVLPMIAPTLRVVALLMTIWSIRRFEIIYLLTGGGPVDSTNTLVINVYRTAFSIQKLGMASAIGMLGLLVSLAVTVIFFVVDRREGRRLEDA